MSEKKIQVTLGNYKGVEVKKAEIIITEEEVKAELERARQYAVTTQDKDGAAELGDEAVIDFVGYIDGEAFAGGDGTDFPLKLGSNTFIPGFEDQLIGANIDEEKEINVTFPEEYQAKELAGKAAVFKCTVHSIKAKELPELDDEFVSDVSEKSETVDAYKAEVKAKIKERKENEGKQKREDQSVEQAVANAEMDIPEAMIDTQVENMVDDFARRIQSQGLSMEQYMQFTGATVDSLKEQMKPQAVKRIESRLVLEKVAEVENIQISDEKLDEELAKMAEMYKMELDKFKELVGEYEKEQMKKDLAVQEAVTLMADSAKEA